VLSDSKKRSMYDAGLYDPQEEEDEVSASELPFICIQICFCFFSFCVAFMEDLCVCLSYRGFLIFWKKCCL